jgi:hypothetical protein
MKAAKKRTVNSDALRYNHLFLKLLDGSNRHLLFTDGQIVRAKKCKTNGDDIKSTWVHEIWYDGFVSKSVRDVHDIIRKYDLPKMASKLSHIRARIGKNIFHFYFSKNALRSGIKRASLFEKVLPKISWISDKFKETGTWEGCPKAGKQELELQQS